MQENIWLSKSISAIINNESGWRRKAKMWRSCNQSMAASVSWLSLIISMALINVGAASNRRQWRNVAMAAAENVGEDVKNNGNQAWLREIMWR
jgi:hypothetical protein